MADNDRNKSGANGRAARLEAELRANLKKRKDQARARARAATAEHDRVPISARDDSGK
jgi:hypothetical protein